MRRQGCDWTVLIGQWWLAVVIELVRLVAMIGYKLLTIRDRLILIGSHDFTVLIDLLNFIDVIGQLFLNSAISHNDWS